MPKPSRLPMFPLGTVLVPSMVLPLHVFEPRYRQLVRDCLAGEPELGVVLITRGSEVGGGEVRSHVGTLARIVEVAELPDGRSSLVTVGTHRIRVQRWLEDAPYPLAEVQEWPDEDEVAGDRDDLRALRRRTEGLLRRVLALGGELGDPVAPATTEIHEEPVLASHQMVALSPLGPHDRQRLLEAPGAGARLELLHGLLLESDALLQARLAEGDDADGI